MFSYIAVPSKLEFQSRQAVRTDFYHIFIFLEGFTDAQLPNGKIVLSICIQSEVTTTFFAPKDSYLFLERVNVFTLDAISGC